MADSALSRIKNEVTDSPAAGRLKDELRDYVRARAEHTVTNLGRSLGTKVAGLAESGGPAAGLAKGGKALSEGKSPAQAALTAGASQLKDTLKDKVKGVFGKGRKSGGGKSKSVTIVEDIDVGVPVREAYDQWSQFQEFSTFAKGVVSVEKADDTSSNWKVKVAKSTRSWKANVTEQVPDERITWTTEGAKGTVKGVVTFHAITDDLTRVLLVLQYYPKGLFEKTGNIWRAQGRRARLDLKLYRAFLTMRGEATDGWRGEIRDGEVVVGHEEAVEAEDADEAEYADEPEDGENPEDGEEPEDEESGEEEGEEELTDEESGEEEPAGEEPEEEPGDEEPEEEPEAEPVPDEDDDAPEEEYDDEDSAPERGTRRARR